MKKTNVNVFILIICSASMLVCVLSQKNENICTSKTKCNECIQQAECVWCTQKNSTTHCLNKKDRSQCESNNIENPNSEVNVISEDDPSSIISPTKLNLKLRVKQPKNINFTFTQPKDIPVDLYFLMDISYTMRVHRDELASLASKIVAGMTNYTSNVRIGFGSFVDKPISPFAYTANGKLINPCPQLNCALPYSFKNHLSLTKDTQEFSLKVDQTKLSGNIDTPEGSLEALMQAIVCKNEIGWREDARKLIILSTDTIFHIAGDGKLAGIDKPNDGLCHIKNNTYTYSLQQDYPSIGQIAAKIKESNIIVIFAVTEAAQKVFEKLRDRISDKLSFVGILSAEKNIVNILRNISYEIAYTVKIDHNFGNDFSVKFTSNCENFNHVNATCTNVKPGDSISFTAKLELINCFQNMTKANYKIYPSGLNKHISIGVDYLCQCNCEKIGEKQSPSCSNFGELQCGICKCPSGKTGVSCECDTTENFLYNASWNENNCIKENTTEVCSGAGYCNCGQCVCDQKIETKHKIYGKYCECNDSPCYDDTGDSCSNHGSCSCGRCSCNEGWMGQKCDCPTNTDTCRTPNSNETCSGKGNCVCGECKCDTVNGYTLFGEYCQTCLNCPQCPKFSSCVECKLFKQGIYNETECEEKCGHCKIEPVEDVEIIVKEESCSFIDGQGCLLKFKYDFNVDDPQVTVLYVQREKQECPQTASVSFLLGVPILSILVATLIALAIYKLVTTLQYRQEYAKFEKELEFEKNELNPLYKTPCSRVENPLYGQN